VSPLVLFAAVLLLSIVGCSAPTPAQGPEGPPPEAITVHTPGNMLQANIDGSRIFGPELELTRDPDGMRGHSPLGSVDLRMDDDDTIRGMVGAGSTELHVEHLDDDGFRLRGLFAGRLGTLEIRSDRVQGQVGACQYDLRCAASSYGAAYDGQRVCGVRLPESTTLTLSPAVTSLEALDRGALMAIMLARR
jgi:hypothetical protein